MAHLPVELIEPICRYLCLHCTEPEIFPHADAEDARQRKSALAGLARTCKLMHMVAQPFLYHYYASGNMPRMLLPNRTNSKARSIVYKPRNDGLHLFFRTIAERPDLAAHVQALQLTTPPSNADASVLDAILLLRDVSNKIGLSVTFWDIRQQRPIVYYWLQQIVLLLCSNVSKLLVEASFVSLAGGNFQLPPGRKLLSLKSVGLVSDGVTDHLSMIERLDVLAPNIETISAADVFDVVTGSGRWDPWNRLFKIRLPNVRKLVLNDISPVALSHIVRDCPQLEELEYTHHGHTNDDRLRVDVRTHHVLSSLTPLSHTLRRLSLILMDNADPKGNTFPDPRTPLSLQRLERLEQLTITQAHFYGFVFAAAESDRLLLDMLPQSIKDLHIMYVYQDPGPELEALAREAPKEMPNLRSLRISPTSLGFNPEDDDPTDAFPILGHRIETMERLCEASGIGWSWRRAEVGAIDQSAFPGERILSPTFA